MASDRPLAELAYEAYALRVKEKRKSMGITHVDEPRWMHLSPVVREGWEAAVTTIKESTKGRQPVEIDHECG